MATTMTEEQIAVELEKVYKRLNPRQQKQFDLIIRILIYIIQL